MASKSELKRQAAQHSWNHRVMEFVERGEIFLGIVEVHYDGDIPAGYTVPVAVIADDVDGLRWTLERMLDALTKPVLKPSDCEREKKEG